MYTNKHQHPLPCIIENNFEWDLIQHAKLYTYTDVVGGLKVDVGCHFSLVIDKEGARKQESIECLVLFLLFHSSSFPIYIHTVLGYNPISDTSPTTSVTSKKGTDRLREEGGKNQEENEGGK